MRIVQLKSSAAEDADGKRMVTETNNLPAIEFRNVSLSFDEKPVLTDLNFKLERGEMIFITGVSGSGKSVLLRLAMALDHPDSGQVLIEGQDVGLLDEVKHPGRAWLVLTSADPRERQPNPGTLDDWQVADRREFENSTVFLLSRKEP